MVWIALRFHPGAMNKTVFIKLAVTVLAAAVFLGVVGHGAPLLNTYLYDKRGEVTGSMPDRVRSGLFGLRIHHFSVRKTNLDRVPGCSDRPPALSVASLQRQRFSVAVTFLVG